MRNLYAFLFFFVCGVAIAQNPGDIDPTFNNKADKIYFYGAVKQSLVQPDGKTFVVGDFVDYKKGSIVYGESVRAKGIVRHNSDHSVDTSFALAGIEPNNIWDTAPKVVSVGLQSDGKIIVGVEYYPNPTGTGTLSGVTLARLNPNGSRDTSFTIIPTYNGVFKVLSNNKILSHTSTTVKRYNADGNIDSSFAPRSAGNGTVFYLSDGSIVFVTTTTANSQPAYYLTKLDSNGVSDATFNLNNFLRLFNCNLIHDVALQPDGKLLVGGTFYRYFDTNVSRLVRLNADGSIDTTFNNQGFGTVSAGNALCSGTTYVRDIAVLPDGKIMIAGSFLSYGAQLSKHLVRLNADGSADTTFDTGTGFEMEVFSVNPHSNGDYLIGTQSGITKYKDFEVSSFLQIDSNGALVNEERNADLVVQQIIKNTDGGLLLLGTSKVPYQRGLKSLDGNGNVQYNANLFAGFNSTVGYTTAEGSSSNAAVQTDGKIIVCGNFSQYNGNVANGIIRLNSDYTIDSSFSAGTISGTALSVVVQPDNKILVGGLITTYNGTTIPNGIVRLNSDGTIDSSFNLTVAYYNDGPKLIRLLSDGKILANGHTLIRYNGNGIRDTSFVSSLSANTGGFELLPNDKILLYGMNIRRLNSDGSVDSTFQTGFCPSAPSCCAVQQDGKILLGGYLESYHNIAVRGLIRLNTDGTLDRTFTTGAGFSNFWPKSLVIDAQGRILVGGAFTRYNGSWCSGIVRLLGGDAYLIKGKNKFDSDSNGCTDLDLSFPNLKFNLVSGTSAATIIGNTTGDYFIPVPSGIHTLTPVFENPSYLNISPASVTADFPAMGSVVTQDFCITSNGTHPDLEVSLLPITVARPGFDAQYKLVYKNKGNQAQSGTVRLTFNDAVLDVITATPGSTTQATNLRTWNFTNLLPFETRQITLKLNLNTPTETPPLTGGSILNYEASITSAPTDETPNDNTFTLNQTVVNSYDPNDKTCLQGTVVGTDKIGEYVHYVIRFENTGTYAAQNITVTDYIDTDKFDISTLIPVNGSHLFTTKISQGNKVDFIFENINLPFADATNDGYVAFKIKTKPTLVAGDTFTNGASIYFDYNSAIVTNTYSTLIQTLGTQDFNFTNYFTLYPNPVSETLHLAKKDDIELQSVSVYNSLGQLVLVVTNARNTATMDVSQLAAGNYFVKIQSDKGTSNTKFIKL